MVFATMQRPVFRPALSDPVAAALYYMAEQLGTSRVTARSAALAPITRKLDDARRGQ
jgi:hypothetical protein